jgi:nucleotide-binding universal stress UspA family protein
METSPHPDSNTPEERFTVIHPIHGKENLLVPFMHALSLVYALKGELEVIDVRGKGSRDKDLSIRNVFERWGKLPVNSKREDVEKTLNIRIKKIIKDGGPKKEIAKRLKRRDHDILVAGLHEQKGLDRLFGQDLIEYLVQYFRQTTLYMPSGVKPFVNRDNGEMVLNKIIIPVADDPSPDLSFQMLHKLLKLIPGQSPEIYGLHVGDTFPLVPAVFLEGISWKEILKEDNVAQSITALATEVDADLIIMSTNGRDTFFQKIAGSISEQVLKETPCPVLAVAVPE